MLGLKLNHVSKRGPRSQPTFNKHPDTIQSKDFLFFWPFQTGKHDPFHDKTLQWRHNGHDTVSNHQPRHCLLNRLFGYRSKKTSKLHVTGLCVGNSPETGEFPAQMANNAENVSIWWRHHDWYHSTQKLDWCACDTAYQCLLSMNGVHSFKRDFVRFQFTTAIGRVSQQPIEIMKHVEYIYDVQAKYIQWKHIISTLYTTFCEHFNTVEHTVSTLKVLPNVQMC